MAYRTLASSPKPAHHFRRGDFVQYLIDKGWSLPAARDEAELWFDKNHEAQRMAVELKTKVGARGSGKKTAPP